MEKGNWYYEIQILMFVIMWQHDMSHKLQEPEPDGFRWGRLHIWKDTAWLHHGIISGILYFWSHLVLNLNHVRSPRTKFRILKENAHFLWNRYLRTRPFKTPLWRSVLAFIILSKAGLRISYSKSNVVDLEIFRFFWNGENMKDMPDIDRVDASRFATLTNGHSTIFYTKEYNKHVD